MTETFELVTLAPEAALTIFQQKNGLDPILSKIREELDKFEPDLATSGGRAAIASMAHKVARSKTALDEMGKKLVANLKEIPKLIDVERKRMRDILDEWRDEIRAPLTEFEEKEKERVRYHTDNVATLRELSFLEVDESSFSIKERLNKCKNTVIDDAWEEFKEDALKELLDSQRKLEAALERQIKIEEEKKELEKLKKEAAEREQKDREERIKKEAVDAALRAEKEKSDRELRLKQQELEAAEKQKLEAIKRAEEAEHVAKEKQERDIKIAQEKQKSEFHKQEIEKTLLCNLMLHGNTNAVVASKLIAAIKKGDIKNLVIIY